MGCWYETCGLTNLPIPYHEDTVMVLLAMLPQKGFACYTTDYAVPIGLPIYGKYDDYGTLESFENEADVVTCLERLNFSNSEINQKVPFTTLDDLQKNVETLSIQTWATCQLSKVLFKRSAWDAMIAHQENTIPWREAYHAREEGRAPKNLRQVFEELFTNLKQDYVISSSLRDRTNFKSMTPIEPFEMTPNQIKLFIDFMIFNDALQDSRRDWRPTSGSGSQNMETNTQEFIAGLTLTLAKSVRTFYDDLDHEMV